MNRFVMSKIPLSPIFFFRIQLSTSEELGTGSSSGHNADRFQHFYPWSLWLDEVAAIHVLVPSPLLRSCSLEAVYCFYLSLKVSRVSNIRSQVEIQPLQNCFPWTNLHNIFFPSRIKVSVFLGTGKILPLQLRVFSLVEFTGFSDC